MSREDIIRLKAQIITAFDKAPSKYKLPEGEGHVLTLGLNRVISVNCVLLQPRYSILLSNCPSCSSSFSRTMNFQRSQ